MKTPSQSPTSAASICDDHGQVMSQETRIHVATLYQDLTARMRELGQAIPRARITPRGGRSLGRR